jgi:hypothetical protein
MSSPDKPTIIYHYCGVSGFHGILSSKKVWLSNTYYMNDYMEHRWILKKAMLQLEQLALTEANRNFCERFRQVIKNVTTRPYACCFSAKPDLLSQWRAYADDGAGYAIGFSTEGVKARCGSFAKDFDISLESILYKGVTQDEALRVVLSEFLKTYNTEFPNGPAGNEDVRITWTAFGHLWRLAAHCKNHGFREEKELRIVLMPNLRELKPGVGIADVGISDLCFRVSGNRIIPYFTFPFGVDDIVRIVLGPKNVERKHRFALELLLRHNGYDFDRIKIDKSEASYR